MTRPDHNELLGMLTSALKPPPVEPSEGETETFLALFSVDREAQGPHRSRRDVVKKGAIVVAAVLGLGGLGVASAATAGVPLPRPVRIVADALGLPVDSVAYVDAKVQMRELSEALESGDVIRVELEASELRGALARLDGDERADMGAEPDALLRRADDMVNRARAEASEEALGGGQSGSGSPGPAGTSGSGGSDSGASDPSGSSSGPGSGGGDDGGGDDGGGEDGGGDDGGHGGDEGSGDDHSGSGSGDGGSGGDDGGSGSGDNSGSVDDD